MPADQKDAYEQIPIEPATVPADTELPVDGYDRLSPGVIGAGHRVIYAVIDDKGIGFIDAGEKLEGDNAKDIHRTAQIQMYSRLKRERLAALNQPTEAPSDDR
jgi:hypothetical protein